jgi:transposase
MRVRARPAIQLAPTMDVIYGCCAGLDVHKASVVACVRRLRTDGRVEQQVRTFGTTTADLLELSDWLAGLDVLKVAMESTGVYWKPVYQILADRLPVIVINPTCLHQVEGRKTDVTDSQWIAQLLQFGLLRRSFVPPEPIRALRDLTRQRTVLVRQRAAVANRIQQVLEDANIKLGDVTTDVLGVSGRAMLEALIEGQTDPKRLAELARGTLRSKRPQLERALLGRVTEHHRFQLRGLLDQVYHLDAQVARYDARVEAVLTPYAAAAGRLETIPGVSRRTAEVILAEVGADMGQFPSAGHLCAWAGMSPGNEITGGKRRSGRTTKGSVWLRTALVQSAWAAARSKGTSLSAAYRRWVPRLGRKRALVAVGHKILVLVYHLLKEGTEYVERPAA